MMPSRPKLYGARYSVYTRIARLAFEEKKVPYDLHEVDVFAPDGAPADHLARHPFGRIPSLEHGNVSLYETSAIVRYVDEAFPGPKLQPETVEARARMNQVMSIMDSYAFRSMVWDVFVERVRVPQRGGTSDEKKVAKGLSRAETILKALSAIKNGNPWLAASDLSLADLHAAPMLTLFRLAPEGTTMLAAWPDLSGWLARLNARPSMIATRSPAEG